MRPPSVATVRTVVFASIALTAIHFTDNTVNIEDYPGPSWQPAWFDVLVALSWPLLTALGVLAYRAYRDGRFPRANMLLVAYSYTGLVSIGHFFSASPSELTTFGLVTVLIDITVGSVVLALGLWSVVARRRAASAAVSS